MVMPLCPLYRGVSLMNSPITQVMSQNQTLQEYVACNWSYGHFCDCLAYFGQNLVAMATSLRPLQSEMSSLDWSATKTPVISNHILIISRRNPLIYAFRAILVPKLVTMVMGVGTWGQGGQQPTLEKIREFPPWKYQPWSENFQAVVRQ